MNRPNARRSLLALAAAAAVGLAAPACGGGDPAGTARLEERLDRLTNRIEFLEEQMEAVDPGAGAVEATTTTVED